MQNSRKYQTMKRIVLLRRKFLSYLKCLLIVLMVLFSSQGLAALIADINVGRVAIDDQSANTQTAAGRAALKQVLIKMSGSLQTVEQPAILRAIVNYEQYLIASSFVQQRSQLMFEARFNQEKLHALLKATGQPIWANLRPSATLWLAEQNLQGDVRWLNQNTAIDFNQALQQAAFERGVGIILPLGDLSDSMAISDFDVWTQNTVKLIPQSMRYDTVFTISGTINPITQEIRQRLAEQAAFLSQQQALDHLFNAPTDDSIATQSSGITVNAPSSTDQLQLDWIISSAQEVHIGKLFLTELSEAPSALVDQFADILAQQYAVSGERSAADAVTRRLSVRNIRSLSDFNQALALVNAMPQISRVELSDVQGDTASFVILLNGNSEEFISLVVLDKRVSQSLNPAPAGQDIQLIWRR